jgi:hypothetical protein
MCVGLGEGVGSVGRVTEKRQVMKHTTHTHLCDREALDLGVTNTLQGGAYIMSDCELAPSSTRKLFIGKQKRSKSSS